ncbi:uncharacterized protein DSM5745_00510 [Aspergillus mulundensis]|uniref:Uncharacterized protein n=1 Tax=Aspergillus mulundensis TaxID=1810919 RepID=A0A3D8T5A4_9EURO|nr:Uncharacterized protein DSM5745_00510 [Aspergillus mulundensis]RDW93188.1 Uncharacterized protein DSM5745_00510 [Aspergillus mulundensis]
MRFSKVLTGLLFLAVSAAATPTPPQESSPIAGGHPGPRPRPLPPCNSEYRPCRCPPGSTFKNFTSFSLIGAPAAHVQIVMGDFFDMTFQSLTPNSTTGSNQVAGATRSFNFTVPAAGYYLFREELTKWKTWPDGSFIQEYRQHPDPPLVKVPGGGGGYYGMWQRIIGQQTLIPNETALVWKNWRCDIGEPFPAVLSHENGMNKASSMLQDLGLHTGVDIKAYTTFYEVRDD